jgi:ubiquinone/menaquinone biosynthesis C-methylase UbiE
MVMDYISVIRYLMFCKLFLRSNLGPHRGHEPRSKLSNFKKESSIGSSSFNIVINGFRLHSFERPSLRKSKPFLSSYRFRIAVPTFNRHLDKRNGKQENTCRPRIAPFGRVRPSMNNKARPVSFCRIARVYNLLEKLVFKDALEKTRIACLDSISEAKRILLLGEGDGRFLAKLTSINPDCLVTVLDASPIMLALAKTRVPTMFQGEIHFCKEDVTKFPFPFEAFDAVVSHFFLDCFTEEMLSGLLEKLSSTLRPSGKWLIADFVEPSPNTLHSLPQFLCLRILYAFFGLTCGIEARRVVSPHKILRTHGLRESRCISFSNGFLASLVFIKQA